MEAYIRLIAGEKTLFIEPDTDDEAYELLKLTPTGSKLKSQHKYCPFCKYPHFMLSKSKKENTHEPNRTG